MIHEKHSSRSAWPGFAVATLIVLALLMLTGCGDGSSPPAPTPTPPPSSFSYVVWADTRGNYSTLATLSAQAVTHNPAFTLYAGDGESNGFTTPETDIFLAAIDGNSGNGLSARTLLVRGNHDALDVAVFPAASLTVPEMTWFAPSELTVCEAGQFVIGAVVAVHVKVTVTGELFHPWNRGEEPVQSLRSAHNASSR